MEIQCGDCGNKFEATFDEEPDTCPECGFGPEKCSHPVSYRESEWIYDAGEEQNVEQVYCGKCGQPL